MSRRARLTILELGASPAAWAACHSPAADDWIVVAQQSDEPPTEFTERVSQRARRLRKEDAQIDVIDMYTSPRSGAPALMARRAAIKALSGQIAEGGRLTLWSTGSEDTQKDAGLDAFLAQLGPVLAERQIAMNQQSCDRDEPSGIRQSIPAPPRTGFEGLTDFDDLA